MAALQVVSRVVWKGKLRAGKMAVSLVGQWGNLLVAVMVVARAMQMAAQ